MSGKQYTQGSENMQSTQYVSQFSIFQGTLSPTGTFNDIYTPLVPQNTQRNANRPQDHGYMYPDTANWENLKLPEKIDFLEITNKDLSPGSYCSNIDSLLPLDGSFNSPYNNRYDNQWYNSTNMNYGQKVNEYASCAQANKFNDSSKPGNLNNALKNNIDMDMFKSCAYYNTDVNYIGNSELHRNKMNSSSSVYNNYNCYYPLETNFCSHNSQMSASLLAQTTLDILEIDRPKESYNLGDVGVSDQQTEASNEESDIIVEDSSSECSEEVEKAHLYDNKKCLVCNTIYTPLGLQFYYLTSENPLTMSSQTPVIKKILKLFDKDISPKKHFLCNNCLGLINAIDHLQMKLDNFYRDLKNKFKKSCIENKVQYKALKIKKKKMYPKYKCKICKRITWVKDILYNHLIKHKKGFLCEVCGRFISSFKQFKLHLTCHNKKHVPMLMPFVCSNRQCEKTFRTRSNLKEHENFCLGILPYACKNSHCDKKFATITKLKNHTRLKHDKKFKAICSICNTGFVKLSDYKSHKITHNTDKKFSCSQCGKAYKTASNLNFHLKSHDKKLPFICTVCKKGFMRKEYLEAHVNNHKGVKNYSCSLCDKKFVSQKNLDAHFKYHEGNLKTNTCNICGRTITSGFAEHLRVHSNMKEYDCDVCSMSFNTKNSLAKHKKRKHLAN